MNNRLRRVKSNEQGFASVVIALIIIMVLALLTVGFAQLSRREQQSALDKQLSNQAYYAAEAGVNDIYNVIQNCTANSFQGATCQNLNTIGTSNNNQCLTAAQLQSIGINSSNVNPSSSVSYSCVIVSLAPPNQNYDLQDGDSRSAIFTPANVVGSPSNIILTVNWQSSSTPAHTAAPATSSGGFPAYSNWHNGSGNGYPAVLQFSITPFNNSGFNRNDLINSTYTTFLYPTRNGTGNASYPFSSVPNTTYNAGVQGNITDAACSGGSCNAKITVPYGANLAYLVHLRAFYDDSNITLSGVSGSINGASFNFKGAV